MSRILMFALAAGLSLPVAAQQTDADFIATALERGLERSAAAFVVMETTTNTDVKGLARRIYVDHSIINDELLKLARSRSIELRVSPPKPMTTEQPVLTPPERVAGIDEMVKSHQETIDLFDAASDHSKDKDLKEWLEQKLMSLEETLKAAKILQEKLSGK